MLQKQSVDISFAQGLDQKTDPKRVQAGKFLTLTNSIFTKAGLLTKRNGFAPLAPLPNDSSLFLTTFNGNLTAIGDTISAYSKANSSWVAKGDIKPVDLSVLPIIRNNLNQVQADSVVAPNGLVLTAYTEVNGGTNSYKYVIADSITGQNIIAPGPIPPGSGTVEASQRVFLLGNYFIIIFTNSISGVPHLQYVAISTADPSVVIGPADIAAEYTPESGVSWDGVVSNSQLYIAYNAISGGQSIKVTSLTAALIVSTPVTFAGQIATNVSLAADVSNPTAPIIWVTYFDSSGGTANTLAVDKNLFTVLAPSPITLANPTSLSNVATAAQSGLMTAFFETKGVYDYDSSIPTNYIGQVTCTQSGTMTAEVIIVQSVGLASKAFIIDGTIYVLIDYVSFTQPTYFLMNSAGVLISKLAYSNSGSLFNILGLPSVTVTGNVAQIAYLIKDLVESINKGTNLVTNTPIEAVYAQVGVNLVSFTIGVSTLTAAEIGDNLNISGGFVWAYDGYLPVEQGFHLWPDYVEVSDSPTGGMITAGTYFYQATYEWSDNQGNLFRSAPSIPVSITVTGTTNAITVHVPTLRLTAKVANPVKIVIYRWSTNQQVYYQVTSIIAPVLNSTLSAISIAFVDTLADSAIIGNNIIYTNGGVVEDIGGPASSNLILFNDRLWALTSEDRNLLWYSKQVIEATPVEFSDLFTIYVAPSIGAQGSTGPITALSAMDDKLIVFKRDAIYYINGNGPDNTGANSQYSDPTFITAVVGSTIQNSIVFIPSGLMFQSDKGIWLLGRDLGTSYIGAPVENFTLTATVLSAVAIPGTTQVRFTLDSGVTLMYDYYYGQWGSFSNIPAISSTLYTNLHTYLDSFGRVFQESPGIYLDNSSPVLMSFTTGWISLAGFQGYERFYFMYINGDYITPFNLYCSFAYDFASGPSQAVRVIPENIPSTWGSEALWGTGSAWGGVHRNFEARVFPEKQKCESFQIIVQELYDASFGVAAGQGLTLSGLNVVVGTKRGFRTQSAGRSFG